MDGIKLAVFLLVAGMSFGLFCQTGLAETVDTSGVWEGSWYSHSGRSGNISATISQSGTSISGQMNVTDTDCGDFSNLSITGSVSGNVATFEANAYCPLDGSHNTLRYTNGIVSGNNCSGDYHVYSDGQLYDWGTFSITRVVNVIRASAGSGGTISPSGAVYVDAGTNQTFTITPHSGYEILDVKVDGVSVGAVTSYTFSYVQANHRIVASFYIPAPEADFTAEPTTGPSPLTVEFNDTSTGNISDRTWNFGDGTTSTATNPTHTYEQPGGYTVRLTVTGPGGSDAETKSDYITATAPMPWVQLLLED